MSCHGESFQLMIRPVRLPGLCLMPVPALLWERADVRRRELVRTEGKYLVVHQWLGGAQCLVCHGTAFSPYMMARGGDGGHARSHFNLCSQSHALERLHSVALVRELTNAFGLN